MSLRVLHLMAGARVGGAETFFERLLPALARAGVVQQAVIRHHPQRAALLTAAGIPVTQTRFAGALDLVTPWRIRGVVRHFAPQVVLAWMGRAAAALPTARDGLVTAGRLGGVYDLKRFRRARHLAANTDALVRWIVERGWPAERVRMVPNFAQDLAGGTPPARAALGTPPAAPVILALGRLHPNKAFDVLVRALPLVPRAHLWLAGSGPEEAPLRTLAAAQGVADRVHMIGWRSDTADLLAGADVLCCPSRAEPLGNVVLEAWSAGVPVVAANADGPAALIADGADGLLVPREQPQALAAALNRVLDDRDAARCLAQAGRLRFEHDFAEAPVIARWTRYLADIAPGGVPCAA
ncbi:glycosyltransferase [Zavarzinia sp. CC-PAN008]|uniref:glycosyltransferase n=1 Tax=Zavarzinia sp. CC-PAN008 TaxID=3243332 RepID=UPI003F7482A6